MTLYKTAALSAINVGIRVLGLLVLNKLYAICMGPAGYAIVGQVQSIILAVGSLSGGAIATGVTKYTAEYMHDDRVLYRLWRTAFVALAGCSVGIVVLALIFHNLLSGLFLLGYEFPRIYVWVVLGGIGLACSTVGTAVLNGMKRIRQMVIAGLVTTGLVTAASSWLTLKYGENGAIIGLGINGIIGCMVLISFTPRNTYRVVSRDGPLIDAEFAARLLSFGLISVVTGVLSPLTQIAVRARVVDVSTIEVAGYWQASARLGDIYIMFATSTLSAYYLPRLSEITAGSELRRELQRGIRLLVSVGCVSALSIYLARDVLILWLFTPDFEALKDYLPWQLGGDVFKMIGWLQAFTLIARAKLKIYLSLEIGFAAFYIASVYQSTALIGPIGASAAYFASFVLYALAGWLFVQRIVRNSKPRKIGHF